MPHILVEGPITLADVARRHAPWADRQGDRLVKFERLYLEVEARAALLETLVVDRGHTQRFLVQLSARDGGLMVRCEPMTDPEKTAGVKHALALVAERIRSAAGGRYGTTNIPEFLIREPASEGGD